MTPSPPATMPSSSLSPLRPTSSSISMVGTVPTHTGGSSLLLPTSPSRSTARISSPDPVSMTVTPQPQPMMIMGGTTLPTTTPLSAQGAIVGTHRSPSPIQVTSSPPHHTHPASYLGAVLQPTGGTPLLLSSTAKEPSLLPHLWATTAQAAITPPPMACQSRPCCRPGRRHRPRAPNQSDGAIPSLPQPLLGGTLQPTNTPMPTLARATVICCSLSPKPVTVSPSTQPFTIHRTGDIVSSGERNASFRDCGDHPRKRPRRKPHARRVCWRHGPCTPSLGSLCGRRHRPWAPSLPEAF